MPRRKPMNGRMAATRSIVVLEAPWGLHKNDQLRVSVLPFIQGMAQVHGNIDVLHARFFDKRSFDQALEHLTTGDVYDNTIVYIAGHGGGRKIQGVDIGHLMFQVAQLSKPKNISGILLGSCLVGNNTTTLETYLTESALRWMAGYKCSVDWMPGTLLDLSLLERMLDMDITEENLEAYKQAFLDATELFDMEASIGEYENAQPAEMGDALVFAVQPAGKGKRPKSFVCDELYF